VRRLIQYLFKAASIARLRDASNVVEGRSKTFRRFTGRWIAKHHPDIPFERFADDAVCHCSEKGRNGEVNSSEFNSVSSYTSTAA
jgi:hypothetical protein